MDVNAFSGRYGVVLRFDVNDGGEMLRKQKVQKEIQEVSGQENVGRARSTSTCSNCRYVHCNLMMREVPSMSGRQR